MATWQSYKYTTSTPLLINDIVKNHCCQASAEAQLTSSFKAKNKPLHRGIQIDSSERIIDIHDKFAKIASFQQANKGLRCVLQAIDHLFAVVNFPTLQHPGHVLEKFVIAMAIIIKNDKSLDLDPFDENCGHEH